MVECRTDHSCGGSSVISTMRDCCDHDIEPSGLAYTIPGNQACHLCPVGKIMISVFYYSYLNSKCNTFGLKVVTSGITQYLVIHNQKFAQRNNSAV